MGDQQPLITPAKTAAPRMATSRSIAAFQAGCPLVPSSRKDKSPRLAHAAEIIHFTDINNPRDYFSKIGSFSRAFCSSDSTCVNALTAS